MTQYMTRLIEVFVMIFFFSGCCIISPEDCVIGSYSVQNHRVTSDTLTLQADGKYVRVLRRKVDGKLLMRQRGNWKLSGNDIELENYHLDFDDTYPSDYLGEEDSFAYLRLQGDKIFVFDDLGFFYERIAK